jgi:hypothetical protein
MKKLLYLIVLVACACSSPKYTASFNYYDKSPSLSTKSETVVEEQSRVVAQSEQLLASTSLAPVDLKATPKTEVRKTYIQMTKTERKALRAHLKSEMKAYVKEQKKNFSIESTQASLDEDLKLAAIFGAVGIVALIIGGDIFYVIGAIALIIGVVFFVKWLMRQ